MIKHTSGPWKPWNETITGEIAIQARFQDGSDDGIPFNIAFVIAHPAHGDGKYHTRLIAAAPEMVERLKELENFVSTIAEEGRINWKNDAPIFWSIVEDARALLTRIEGESNE